MPKVPTQIRIDSDIKKQAAELFRRLGLDMSGAVNLFLYQCVLRDGLPFPVEMPRCSRGASGATEEARRISRDPCAKGYANTEDLQKSLPED